MQWDEYYEKIDEWANSTAVNRLSKLESFGPSEEVTYVINELAFENEKAATRLLKMATNAGVKFSGEQLVEMCLVCEESELERAIRYSCDIFKDEDIDVLYGCFDDELVAEVAKRAGLKLPADLQELYDEENEMADWKEEAQESFGTMSYRERAEVYEYVLDCLYQAREKVVLAWKLSVADTGSDKRALSIAKHACLAEAEPYIAEARIALEEIESMVKDTISIRNTRLNLGKMTLVNDVWVDGRINDWIVQRRIGKILKSVESAIREVERIRELG